MTISTIAYPFQKICLDKYYQNRLVKLTLIVVFNPLLCIVFWVRDVKLKIIFDIE